MLKHQFKSISSCYSEDMYSEQSASDRRYSESELPHLDEASGGIPLTEQETAKQQAMHIDEEVTVKQRAVAQPDVTPGFDHPQALPKISSQRKPVDVAPPRPASRRRRIPIWMRVALLVMLLFLLGGGGVAAYYYYTLAAPVSRIVGQQVTRLKGDKQSSLPSSNILSGKRINVLLLGSDTDVKFTNPGGGHTYLAQTDIVVTIDPTTKSVGMLSIPRDFYVNVPGYGMHKLDEAYGLGGVALSRLTIYQDFGIPIDYYAWVGLDGFIKVINTVNGVDVDVTHPIADDTYPDDIGNHGNDIYAVKRLYLAPGPQHLSGPEALEYVRSRHADLVGDFGRSARQQQVLTQLKNKLNNSSTVGELPQLANDLSGSVKTDMQLNDALSLMNFARTLNQNSINRVVLSTPYSSPSNLPSGEAVVVPNCDQIVPVIAKMFDLGSAAACNTQASTAPSSSPVYASHPPSSGRAQAANASEISHITQQMAHAGPLSLHGNTALLGGGIHSLLDLLLLTVFDSPQALGV